MSDPASGAAKAYHCPACGALVEQRARMCGFCRSPVATVRCAHCYEMNVPDAMHCSGCGRQLGLEPLGEPDALRCPDCDVPFDAFRGGPGVLHDCSRCGGQFVDHPLLRDLLERREIYGLGAPRHYAKPNPLEQPVRYVRCPDCGEHMNRKNFGGSSGVIVDVCTRHGTWLDPGELPRILAFVESGGLARARAAGRGGGPERGFASPSRDEARGTVGLGGGTGVDSDAWRTTLSEDLADAGRSLLTFIRGIVEDATTPR